MNMTMTLSVEQMMDQAARETSIYSFKDKDFLPALNTLVDSLNKEANLNELGNQLQQARLTELLKTRLKLEAFDDKFPEIQKEELSPPIVILSLPRTGTTMLQRLLASDRRFLSTLWYEVRFPVPELDWDLRIETDSRIPIAKAEVASLIKANPDLLSIHPLDAMAADEDLLLLETTFLSSVPGSQANIPTYNKFYENDDALAATRYHKKLLQFLQWQRRQCGMDVDAKPWLLKSPAHMYTVAAIRQVYPGARFITSHRNPLACMPSISSFYYNQWVVYSDEVDPTICGEVTSHFFNAGLERAHLSSLEAPASFLDFEYEDLIRKQDKVLQQIYDFIGWDITPECRQGIANYRKNNPRNKRKPHGYNLEQFGLSAQGLKDSFSSYFDRRRY